MVDCRDESRHGGASYENAGTNWRTIRRQWSGFPPEGAGPRFGWAGVATHNEVRNLKRCEGISGVPRVLARTGPTAHPYEYVEGRSLDQEPSLPPGVFERLLVVLQQIHDRGLVHFDMHKRGNIIARPLRRVRHRRLRYLLAKGILRSTDGIEGHAETNLARWTGK
jgi:hypothetical protein